MRRPDFSAARWRKAEGSGDGGCVEVAYADGVIGLRDSKDRAKGPILVFNQREWAAFVTGARSGEFDLDQLAN